jgi:hypothetical protein
MFAEHGKFDLGLLDNPSRFMQTRPPQHAHHSEVERQLNDFCIPDSGYVTASNDGEGFFSLGFRFDSRFLFDINRLRLMLQGIDIERFKGIFCTNQGCKVLNVTDGVLSELTVPYCDESRCETLGRQLPRDFQARLFDTMVSMEEQ